MDETQKNAIHLVHNGKEIVIDVDDDLYKKITEEKCTIEICQQENEPASTSMNNDFKWTSNAIKLLLEVRLKREAQFNTPTCKKKKLWALIATEMNEVGNYNVTADLCDIKYRNLLGTYRTNKKKQTTGESIITWEYFDEIDAVLSNKTNTNPLPETEVITNESNEFKWTNKAIKLLLDLRLKKEAQFNAPTCKKKKLWVLIATEMNNVNITGDLCDIKYRNLLATYRSNKKKQIAFGENSITWEYFEEIDAVLGNTSDGKEVSDTEVCEETSGEETSFSALQVFGRSRKRKLKISLEEYLWEKSRREEQRYQDKKQNEENRVNFEREKWEDSKRLKERQIDALVALGMAITHASTK